MIMLCVLSYARTNCGLRTVIKIINTFGDVFGEQFGKTPSYTTVRNWMLKLGLSVYEEDIPVSGKYGVIIDESIMINKEKLLLVLGFNSESVNGPLCHKDVRVLDMKVGESFKRGEVRDRLDLIREKAGRTPEYGISDGAHNLVGGFKDTGIVHHLDISHTLGNCMKHVYEDDNEFKELTGMLGKIRHRYHLTDKAWLLPPNMRAIARFMNLQDWVEWAERMLGCYDTLEDSMKEAFSFLLSYRELIGELAISVGAIRHVERICKNDGFSRRTSAVCQSHIIKHVVGNANNRRASLGLEMVDYFRRQEELLEKAGDIHHISSDIIESDFGIFKAKKSPNKLYGITSLVLILPLYPKVAEYSDTETQDFKVRLAKVKLKEIDLWARENLSPNRVALRSKTLKKVI